MILYASLLFRRDLERAEAQATAELNAARAEHAALTDKVAKIEAEAEEHRAAAKEHQKRQRQMARRQAMAQQEAR